MTISISLDYDQITFTSATLSTTIIDSLSLKYKKNCGTLSSSINLNSKLGDIENNSLTLNVTDIFSSNTVFDDGVYYFELTAGTTEVGDPAPEPGTYTLTGCVYIGTTSRCKALAKYIETKEDIYDFLITALTKVNECDDCDCSTMCTIYDYLTTLLNSNTTTDVYSSCGCN